MMGAVKFDDQIANGKAKLKGNRDVYEQLKTTLVQFELGFELMPGTRKGEDKEPGMNPFETEIDYIAEWSDNSFNIPI